MPINPDEFRSALSRFSSGVTVVTTKDADGKFFGITVSAFCSVSLVPPLVLICIEQATGSHAAFLESGVFVVNFLGAHQVALSEHFALPLDNKFEGIELSAGIEGVPRIDGALVNLDCRVTGSYPGGDHTIFVGQVEEAIIRGGSPLVYFESGYRQLDQ